MFKEGIYTAKSFVILLINGSEIKGDFTALDKNKEVENLGYTQKWKLGSNAKTVYKFKNGNWFVSWNKGVSYDDPDVDTKYRLSGNKLVLLNKLGEERTAFYVKGDTIEQRKAEGSSVFLTVFEKDPYANIKVKRYEKTDEAALFDLLKTDGEEHYFGAVEKQEQYRTALKNSLVYVCYDGKALCGFIRAREDDGFGVYVLDLLIQKACRGHAYGKHLIEQMCKDFPNSAVYAVSDADGYYEKLGFEKERTVYVIKK